jgi:uncharacterized OB-fold protein
MENTANKQIPCVEGWFTMNSEDPRLIGGRCKSCGDHFFPKVSICRNPYCKKTEPVEEVLLSRRGTLYTFTVNHYKPPVPYHSPDPFVPYANGIVEFPEGLMVQGQIASGYDEKNLKVGSEMELILDKLYDDEKGNEVITWKFKPVSG